MQNQSNVAPAPWKQRLRPYQIEPGRAIVDSVLNHRGLSFSIEMARQAGKNELSAQLEAFLLALHANHDIDAVKCAPTFDPQARISLRRLWSRLVEAGLSSVAEIEAGHVVRLGRARVFFMSAEPEANVAGHSAGLLLEVDEAQDVDEEKFDRDFRPMASVANATVVFYGTAWNDATLLERAKQRHLELERSDGVRRHFEYDWRVVARHNPAYAATSSRSVSASASSIRSSSRSTASSPSPAAAACLRPASSLSSRAVIRASARLAPARRTSPGSISPAAPSMTLQRPRSGTPPC